MHIVGTAGHVDHGKSALIAALTGTNPDRLIEEQTRGMTLDLGFAHLRFDDGVEGGIVDVPGHERFLHNMLAGAAGMELLLLVVDANEGVMPQTIEHLEILRFLNLRRVLVVASKIDLVAPEYRDEAVARIRARLHATIADGAAVFVASATTGENLGALKTRLHDELAAMPRRNPSAPVYLPIDRIFALPGLGTIVTGTLMQGGITAGETLVLEPGGIPAHVRSIGVFGSTRKRVEAGSRVALNLPSIDRHEIARGHAIVGRELSARKDFRVRFLPSPGSPALVRRRTPVRAYLGSAEILGTLVTQSNGADEEGVPAQLHLRDPAVVFPGLRFVLRRPSPMALIGGGYVEGIDLAPCTDGSDAAREAVLAVLRAKGLDAVEPSAIAFAANLREDAVRGVLDRLVEDGEVITVTRPPGYVDAAAARALLSKMLAALADAQSKEPWAMGMTSIALSRAFALPESTLVRVAEYFVNDRQVINRGGYFATVDHRPMLGSEQRAFFDALVPVDEARPLLPVPFGGIAAATRRSQLAGLSRAFDTMLAQGLFVKVGDDLYRGLQITEIRERVEAHFRAHERMTAAEFRDLLGTSRKYAMPLLEWLDAHGVTIRNGDFRTLRKHE